MASEALELSAWGALQAMDGSSSWGALQAMDGSSWRAALEPSVEAQAVLPSAARNVPKIKTNAIRTAVIYKYTHL